MQLATKMLQNLNSFSASHVDILVSLVEKMHRLSHSIFLVEAILKICEKVLLNSLLAKESESLEWRVRLALESQIENTQCDCQV